MFVCQSRFGMCNNRCGNFRYMYTSLLALLASSPGSTNLFNVPLSACKLGVAWGRGMRYGVTARARIVISGISVDLYHVHATLLYNVG